MIVSPSFTGVSGPICVPDVFVVEINVDEVAQHVLIVEEMSSQRCMCGREQIERLARGLRFNDDLRLSTRELS